MEQEEILRVLERVESVFGSVTKNGNSINTWCELLKKYPSDQVNKACDEVLETCHYSPKPADFIEAIKRQPRKGNNYLPHLPTEHEGMVKTDTGWDFPDNCVRHEGQWKKKIDFVCEVLGGASVTAMIKEELGLDSIGSIFKPNKYEKFLNEVLVPMAWNDLATGF